jgi:DNA invertase Pin-like site-specific DNA recombinase
MSTEHQQYSPDNQSAAISGYAESHGFTIVQTYFDAAKSGLLLKNRISLQRLLSDVVTGAATFKAILVYDISRWGRFQDADESAHYEFLCRQAGVAVHYCAEEFTNDGSPSNTILKALKRVMAAEYSRELGVKCFAGKERLAQLAFRMGGQAGYGFRRLVLAAEGEAKRKLESSEYKYLKTDRITLVPGPTDEVSCVQELFRLALHKRFSDVARILNVRGMTYLDRKPWDYHRVESVLTNPKYAGNLVWGRTSQRLASFRVTNVTAQVTKPNAFSPLVCQDIFDCVQAAHRKRNTPTPDKVLLDRLRRLLAKKGVLNEGLLRRSNGVAALSTFVRRFGSIMRAYELVGYRSTHRQIAVAEHAKRTKRLRGKLIDKILELFPGQVEQIFLKNKRPALKLQQGQNVSIIVCRQYRTPAIRAKRWELIPFRAERNFIALLCFTNPQYDAFCRFYVMPNMDKATEYQIKGDFDPWLKRGRRLKSISEFYAAVTEASRTTFVDCGSLQTTHHNPLPK